MAQVWRAWAWRTCPAWHGPRGARLAVFRQSRPGVGKGGGALLAAAHSNGFEVAARGVGSGRAG
eukprot:7327563-Lingulodinium_polyedra.AAC.1